MNILEIRRRQAEIRDQILTTNKAHDAGRISNKAFIAEVQPLMDEWEELMSHQKAYNAASGFNTNTDAGPQRQPSGFRAKAQQVAPIDLSVDTLKSMHRGNSVADADFAIQTKSFNTVDSLLPPELQAEVVGPEHETRLLERLPVLPTSAPSIEYIRHVSTTGTPAITAEGAAKPELVLNTDRVIVAAQKIACHGALSWETMTDWDGFTSYFQAELQRQVIDTENAELLNGDGTTGHLTGLLSTSGILTHATGSDTGLDSVELAIAALRTGSALAEANLLVLHPNTWSALRRTKDLQDRYLVSVDPTQGAANTLWGVPVLPTTTIAAGVGALIDTTKMGYVVVRESLMLRTGTNNDDFSRNLQRWTCEERLALAVERPAAVCKITGLPTS